MSRTASVAACLLALCVSVPVCATQATPGKILPKKSVRAAKAADNPQRRILAYRLYDDPVFKLRGAIADRRFFPLTERLPAALKPTAAPQADAGCKVQVLPEAPGTQNTTACFRYPVDKGLNTHAYVSRSENTSSGRSEWGGGIAVSIAN